MIYLQTTWVGEKSTEVEEAGLFPALLCIPYPNHTYMSLEKGVPNPQMKEFLRESFGELDLCLLEFGGTWEL